MALADSLKSLVYNVRSIPGTLGLRPYAVSIVRRVWTGTHTGDGTVTETETAITEASGQPPKVRWLNDEELAVGGIESGSVEIGPITPDHPGGGTALSAINAWQAAGEEVYVRLVGPRHPNGALYAILNVDSSRSVRYTLRARPRTAQ